MRASFVAAITAPLLLAVAPAQRGLPSPQEALGHDVGADHFLADYSQLTAYWRTLASRSDRMHLREIGKTAYGQTMLMAVISSPQNLAAAEAHRATSGRLAKGRAEDGKPLSAAQIEALASTGRAVIWIDAGLHATESIAGQNILELVWRMVARDDDETRRILDNVILLACPVNPDGMEMVARGYMASGRVGNLPVLYQKYCGHDNNRDHYACNTIEAQVVTRVFYHEWFPQVVYNHHQSAPRGTIIFTPPFRDPFNHNVDPMVVRGVEFIATNMNSRFAWEGKAGVISRSGAPYSMWWNGGLRTTAYFHNMIGILTEVFGHPDPTAIVQTTERRLASSDYPEPIGSRTWHARETIEYLQTANYSILDTAARYRVELLRNMGRMAVNSIERGSRDHWTPTPVLVARANAAQRAARAAPPAEASADEGAASGEAGAEGAEAGRGRRGRRADDVRVLRADDAVFQDPALRDARAYVMAADQRDGESLRRFIRSLRFNGVEVQQATAAFDANGKTFPAGSFVVQCAQAFRPHVLDMFEPQWHPDDLGANGEPIRPYDSAGWTLAMQMGVQVDRVLDALTGPFQPIGDDVRLPPLVVLDSGVGWVVMAGDNGAFRAVNRLLAANVRVERAPNAGGFFVPAGAGVTAQVAEIARDLGVRFVSVGSVPEMRTPLRAARIGVFDPWGGNMEAGWSMWMLDQFDFPYERVYGDAVEAGDLRARYDVLLFSTGLPAPSARGDAQSRPRGGDEAGSTTATTREAAAKVLAAMPPFEDWSAQAGRIERISREKGIPNLRAFVAAGGTLLCFAGQNSRAVRAFDLPVEVGVFRDEDGEKRAVSSREFFIPGSLLGVDFPGKRHPLSFGMPVQIAAMFRRSDVLEVGADAGAGARVVATYGSAELKSGWALGIEFLNGKAAVVECPLGDGRVVLYGPDVLYRGQPHASFKLVFNALFRVDG